MEPPRVAEMSRAPRVVKEPVSLELRRYWELDLGEPRGRAEEIIIKNWKQIIWDICYGLSDRELGEKWGFTDRSFYNFLARRNLRLADIREACKKEEEIARLTRIEKAREKALRLGRPPSSIEEVKIELSELFEELRAQGISNGVVTRYASTWLELAQFAGKPLTNITVEDMRSFLATMMEKWSKEGKDIRSKQVLSQFSVKYITPLRVLAKYLGLPIKPFLKTVEYEGVYRHVRITVRERYEILRKLREMLPEKKYRIVRGLLVLAYETGSRATGLLRGELVKVEKFGMEVWMWKSQEKGKRASITWEKPLKPQWVPYIKEWYEYVNRQEKKSYEILRRISVILKQVYKEVLEEGITKEYALQHPIHVWRHTATNDLLEETNYNLMVVSKRIGWKNPAMIVKVYGDMSEEMLLSTLGYDIKVERARHEFLYGEWLEKARSEGLL
jgi:integrase